MLAILDLKRDIESKYGIVEKRWTAFADRKERAWFSSRIAQAARHANCSHDVICHLATDDVFWNFAKSQMKIYGRIGLRELYFEVGMILFTIFNEQRNLTDKNLLETDYQVMNRAFSVACLFQQYNLGCAASVEDVDFLSKASFVSGAITRYEFFAEFFKRFEPSHHDDVVQIKYIEGKSNDQKKREHEFSVKVCVSDRVLGSGFFRPGFSYFSLLRDIYPRSLQEAIRSKDRCFEVGDWGDGCEKGECIWLK
jgi:hypothetical protein